MIQGSFCNKLNALSYDIYVVFLSLLSSFVRRTSKILPERNTYTTSSNQYHLELINWYLQFTHFIIMSLPARASEQGGIYCIYIQKKIVIERTRDLIYLKFVATDFSLKITSPSTGENSGDSA